MRKLKFKSLFSNYTTSSILGEGGSGTVYRAKDELGNEFAIKYLDPNKMTPEKLKRFKNELFFCFQNKHRNIIRIIDYGINEINKEEYRFYVMPVYPFTLRTLMDKKIEHNKILEYFSHMLDGVEAAHLQNVWHRDLKPENILYDNANNIFVIADFGIAHFCEDYLQTTVKTKQNSRMANFQYAAPEQRTNSKTVDHRADIYALGLILNEMFTSKIISGSSYSKIGDINKDYEYLDEIVDIMVRQSQEERFQSIDLIKQQLIAKENDFFSRQKLSNLKNEVISDFEIDDPLVLNPVKLIDIQFKSDQLVLILNQTPTEKWTRTFKEIRDFGAIKGREPYNFNFYGNTAIINMIREIEEVKLVEYFTDYLIKANKDYKLLIEKQYKDAEMKERERIKQEIDAEERRRRILSKIKL